MTDAELVRQLIEAAYETGYYAGKPEFAQELQDARKRREALRKQVLGRMGLPDSIQQALNEGDGVYRP